MGAKFCKDLEGIKNDKVSHKQSPRTNRVSTASEIKKLQSHSSNRVDDKNNINNKTPSTPNTNPTLNTECKEEEEIKRTTTFDTDPSAVFETNIDQITPNHSNITDEEDPTSRNSMNNNNINSLIDNDNRWTLKITTSSPQTNGVSTTTSEIKKLENQSSNGVNDENVGKKNNDNICKEEEIEEITPNHSNVTDEEEINKLLNDDETSQQNIIKSSRNSINNISSLTMRINNSTNSLIDNNDRSRLKITRTSSSSSEKKITISFPCCG